MKLDDNKEVTESKDILNELSLFYKKLYSSGNYNENLENEFLSESVPNITNEQKLFCDKEISLEECTKAMQNMNINKSPGTDGISVEFYRFSWNDISDLVMNSINAALKEKTLSCEQKRGIIRLIPKKDKDLTLIKNWRPISLLNTDYKLITHVLANRLQNVLPNIISKDQSGYLKSRNISVSIRSIFDIIQNTKSNNSSALLAFIDFEKAFDKLNWIFLQKALAKFGFGNYFREWIQIIYTDIESCVINNGTTSKYFKIKTGVRQGCPLSALLFLIAVETLAIALRNDKNIKGVKVGNKIFKITQLADDTTLFLSDINSLKLSLKLLTNFKNISGLKLNESKTEILQIGVPLTSNYSLLKLKWKKEKVYALGTWFYKDLQKSITETYEKRIDILQSTLNFWSHRKLTWIGKITMIKTLGISKINYAISSIPTPKWFIDRCEIILQTFLWNNKPPRVKHQVLYNNYETGGLRMTNLQHFTNAQKVNWVKRLINDKETVPYEYICQFINMKLQDYLKCNINPNNLSKKLPDFYKEVLQAWFSLKSEPTKLPSIQREVLWNNRFIMIANKSVFNKKLYQNGMIFINDLLENGNLLSYNQLIQKYGNHITFFNYISLLDAIPQKWRNLMKNNTILKINPIEETIFISLNKTETPVNILKSKQVYWFLNQQNIIKPNCIKKWFDKYLIEFSSHQWKEIFCLSQLITSDTRLIEFQFKIIHRVFATDSYVSNFDPSVSKTCIHCLVDNNIPHLFVDCIKVCEFWQHFKTWLNNVEGYAINISTTDIIFGIHTSLKTSVNFCILHAKWFISLRRLDEYNVNFNNFLSYLKGVFLIEKQIAVNRKHLPYFNNTFGNVVRSVTN